MKNTYGGVFFTCLKPGKWYQIAQIVFFILVRVLSKIITFSYYFEHLAGPLYRSIPHVLTLKDPFISDSCIEIKIELNFYFDTSLWCKTF